jgi:agmatinase
MKSLFLVAAAILSLVVAHDHGDHSDQAPLEYVRFPFQPTYRGLNGEGESRTIYA